MLELKIASLGQFEECVGSSMLNLTRLRFVCATNRGTIEKHEPFELEQELQHLEGNWKGRMKRTENVEERISGSEALFLTESVERARREREENGKRTRREKEESKESVAA